MEKIEFKGRIESVQPRIRLLRSFDQRSHAYLGYVLRLNGQVNNESRVFKLGVGPGAHQKHGFRTGMLISGLCTPVNDARVDPVEYYRVSKMKVLEYNPPPSVDPPPWISLPPALEAYQSRGHRRLASNTYEQECGQCIWGCRMAVEMIVDQWKPEVRKYRFETFCYGPLSCPLYKAGPPRKVPGRKGMTFVEEDWVDVQDSEHREMDE